MMVEAPNKDAKALTRTSNKVDKFDKGRGKINKYEALSLALSGMIYEDIGKKYNASKQAVSSLLKPFRKQIEYFKAYDNDPVQFMRYNRSRVSAELDPERLKKMSGKDLVTAEAILTDKIQLLEGKTTSNVAIMDVTREQNNIRQELKDRGLDHLLSESNDNK